MGDRLRATLLALVVCSSVAHADEPAIPSLRWSMVSLLAGRVNPLGLEENLRAGLQQVLYRRRALALADNFIFFGAQPKLNPSYLRFGPTVEVQPLSVLNLKATTELVQWFGSFHYLQSFASPLDDWSDTALQRGSDLGTNYVTTGAHVALEPTLRLKVGPIALQDHFTAEYWAMNVHAGDTVFYEPSFDTMAPAHGWVLANDLDVVYLRNKLIVGVRYSMVQPLYSPGDFRPGEKVMLENGQQRLGPLVAYTFFHHGYQKFDSPTVVLIVNWYLEHRFRTGADVSPALPYGVLAFAFTSDVILH